MLYSVAETAKNPIELIRLWIHEANRVYKDKLVDNEDIDMFDKLMKDAIKKNFEVYPWLKVFLYEVMQLHITF